MKALILAALLAAGIAHADAVATSGKDSIRLMTTPCAHEILSLIPTEFHGQFNAAVALIEGKTYHACWTMRSDGMVIMQYADGDMGAIPAAQFRASPGV